MTQNALVLAPFPSEQLERLSAAVPVVHEDWLATRKLYAPDELTQRLRRDAITHLIVEADFVVSETIEESPSLEVIGLCRGATNHVDIDKATEQGVLVVNTQRRNTVAVAELTLGLVLALVRRIPEAHEYIISGHWDDPVDAYEMFRGSEIAGKTAGIIGLGAIGLGVARRLAALDMKVIGHDPYVNPAMAFDVPLHALKTLLSQSDFVLVHAPPTQETIGMIGEAQLRQMKPGAFLVNTSSPGIVDEQALINALKDRQIAGAALDVFDGQPLPQSSGLLSLDNVVLTPHIGGATIETIQRHARMAVDDILEIIAGRRPDRLVNPEAWPRRRGGRSAKDGG